MDLEGILPYQRVQPEPPLPAPVHEASQPGPSAEQVEVSNRLFAGEQQEAELVAGLMSFYAGSLLLRDLACEHLRHEEDEEEEPRQPKEDDDKQSPSL